MACGSGQYTTHDNAVFEVDGIRRIGIANLPSVVANSASCALSNATIPFVKEIAEKGCPIAALFYDKNIR